MFAGNPASWTLTAEAFFYALHPFLTKVLRHFSGRGALIAAGSIIGLSIVMRLAIFFDPMSWLAQLPWPVLRLNEFVVGMCVAWAFRNGWRLRMSVWVPVTLILGYLIGSEVLARFDGTQTLHTLMSTFTSEAMLVLFALLICAAASADLRGVRSLAFRSRPIVILGEWSYAFYLIHATLISLTRGIVDRPIGGWSGLLLRGVLLAASIAAAGALHVWIERPVERVLRAWQNKRVARRRERRALAQR